MESYKAILSQFPHLLNEDFQMKEKIVISSYSCQNYISTYIFFKQDNTKQDLSYSHSSEEEIEVWR